MYQYQENHTYFAQIADGFEDLTREELKTLGADRVEPTFRGIRFSARPDALYNINYQSRLVSRVLAPMLTFRCRDRNALYRHAQDIDWPALFSVDQTFGIFANVSGNENLRHSKFAALCLKDAVADQFRKRMGRRPNVDKSTPDVWIHLLIQRQQATISLDTSGGSLHRRGYRRDTVAAPMKETLAAAMVAMSGWQGDSPLYDPMCGAGTLLCEAVMAACRIPSGYLRSRFGFQRLPDFKADVWRQVKNKADARIRSLPQGAVAGSDIDGRAVKAASANVRRLPADWKPHIIRRDFKTIESLENRTILCNPPYGVRLGRDDDLGPFYKDLGDFLKQRCKGSTAYIYFGNREMIKKIGLKPAFKKPMRNAGLDGRLVRYDLY